MQQNNNKRIEFIDSLRGFTMLLVVMLHVASFGFETDAKYTNAFFNNLRMPLFFFICGFLVYKANLKWNFIVYKEMLIKKIRMQVIPTFILGSLFTLLVFKGTLSEFIHSPMKLGYWFTLALFEMFVIYYTINFGLQIIYRNKDIPSRVFDSVMVISAATLYCCIYFTIHNKNICDIFSLFWTCKYFMFFTIGILASKYKLYFFKTICKEKWIVTSLLLFSVLSIIINVTNNKLTEHIHLNIILTEYICPTIIALSSIFFVFCFCHKNQHLLDSTTFVGRKLQYIGKRTLDIYLLHYFFIPKLPMVGKFIEKADSPIIELTLSFIIAIMIICFSLLVSKIIKTSNVLGYYLLGNKSK